jgi:hypothetical protein
MYGEDETYTTLVKKSEGNRPLGRLRHRWVHIIRIKGMEWKGVD